ncbi:hypothetical protein EHS25_000922 [Saitozyma podzolica]|uniref:BZIP domain-containing protein n=1 Tax=Saitozyma podzolica TaxID=1890683 RepID=A0A427YXM2_9TREE|nr:hypothetical protein EHS25_000922 [Saitozyma podzolica]
MQPKDATDMKNAVPAWGSYLYQTFLLPTSSPNVATEWLNLNLPFGPDTAQPSTDDFSLAWNNNAAVPPAASPSARTVFIKVEPELQPQPTQPQPIQHSGLSSFYPQPYYYNMSLSTSLLVGPQHGQASTWTSSQDVSPWVHAIDSQVVQFPSPIDSASAHVTPHRHPFLGRKGRASSLDSGPEHSHDEHEPEVPNGVEGDGMIWGMTVVDYRALSARERKLVRNRISARKFRAMRKEHLLSLESTLGSKDLQIKLANEEVSRLRKDVAELKRRLAKWEKLY